MKYALTALLALVFCLMCLAACAGEGRSQQNRNPPDPDRPNSVICVLPGSTIGRPLEQRIKLSPGQKPLTACPAGATMYLDFSARFPIVGNMPPPVWPPTGKSP